MTARDLDLRETPDPELLAYAAMQGWILLTHVTSITEKNQRPSCHTRRIVCSAVSSSNNAIPVCSVVCPTCPCLFSSLTATAPFHSSCPRQ